VARAGTPLERRLLAASVPLLLGLAVLCAWQARQLALRGSAGDEDTQRLLDRPEVMERVVRRLVSEAGGLWDAHPDPEVGRLMQPGRKRELDGITFEANRLGLREREFALPKPEGTVRVVLLGDSFVYGTKLEAEDRMGVLLERWLRRGAGDDAPEIEVLHLGLISWNFLSECAFVRRQVSLLRPDLVIHLTVPNDVDDLYGVRGFGAMSRFTPQHRERANALIHYRHPGSMMGVGSINYLTFGLDHESRGRYERARVEIDRLRAALAAVGAEYFHLLRWEGSAASVRPLFLPDIPPERVGILPQSFVNDETTWVEPQDSHFNARGMELLARYLYAEIRERGLLPGLALEAWPQAEELRRRWNEESRADQERSGDPAPHFPLDERLDFEPLDAEDAAHFHGGVDAEGRLAPYASFAFRVRAVRRLHLRGRGLDRPELLGVTITVAVDGREVGRLRPGPGEVVDVRLELPEGWPAGEYVTVTLTADDHVLVGDDLRGCASFELDDLAFEE